MQEFRGSLCSVGVWEVAHVAGGRLDSGHRPQTLSPPPGASMMFPSSVGGIWVGKGSCTCLWVQSPKLLVTETRYSYHV